MCHCMDNRECFVYKYYSYDNTENSNTVIDAGKVLLKRSKSPNSCNFFLLPFIINIHKSTPQLSFQEYQNNMSNQNGHSNNNAVDGEQLPPIRLPGETMEQSFDRIANKARELGVHPDSLLPHSTHHMWGNSAAHLRSDCQANNSTSSFDITVNPQYRSGTSSMSLTFLSWNITDIKLGSGQHSSSGQQASHGSDTVTSNGNASRQSNPGGENSQSGGRSGHQ